MATIQRQRVSLTGFPGQPGVMTFYFLDAAAAQDDLHALVAQFAGVMPADVTLRLEQSGDSLSDANGDLVGSWVGTIHDALTGGAGSIYAGPVGMCVNWLTATITDGRRLRGRTFIVPAAVGQYDERGTILDVTVAGQQSAAQAFIEAQGTNFLCWHRPQFGPRPAGGGPRPVTRTGSSAPITGSSVPDKAVVLRSRRD